MDRLGHIIIGGATICANDKISRTGKSFPICSDNLPIAKCVVRLHFGDCILDTAVRELRRAGKVKPLSPKAFRLLEVLAERRPHAVAHDELRRALWPGVMVGGTTLARLVNELRVATGDKPRETRFIRTVHRFGYAFCATVGDERTAHRPTGVCYAVQLGARLVALTPGENLIGRSTAATIGVTSSNVSRRHARIVVDERGATLEDLGSRNGTYLGGQPIRGRVDLKEGDHIGIGPIMLIFRVSNDEGTTSGLMHP